MKLASTGKYQVIISDICLPHQKGTDMILELRKIVSQFQVIFITGNNTFDETMKALRAYAFDMFEKPFRNADLLASVERAATKALAIGEESA
jgi:DNA-binding NtrC family response regulator